MLRKSLLNIIGIPLLTFLLFVFECSDPKYYVYELLWCFGIVLVLWGGNGFIIKKLNEYVPWRQAAAPRIFIQLGISTLFTVWITYFATYYLYDHLYEVHFSTLVFRRNLFIFLIISWLYNALYTGNHFFRQWRRSIVEAEELKRQNLISQNEALKHQINPHFLFNSINTLIGLIDENPDLAKEYGYYIARIYRYILEKENNDLVTLKEELGIVELQKELLASRFGEGFILKVHVEEAVKSNYLPPLTLQMLIENAIKHNTVSVKRPLTLEITNAGDAKLLVKNNIQRKSAEEKSTRVGIENIKKRYWFFTEESIEVFENDYFEVILPLLEKDRT